jgi:hypothetical protein
MAVGTGVVSAVGTETSLFFNLLHCTITTWKVDELLRSRQYHATGFWERVLCLQYVKQPDTINYFVILQYNMATARSEDVNEQNYSKLLELFLWKKIMKNCSKDICNLV